MTEFLLPSNRLPVINPVVSGRLPAISRRNFLKSSIAAGLALGTPRILTGAERTPEAKSPNETIRLAVVGLGATKAVGGVGGRGHQLIPRLREIPGVKI